jgi:maltose alpha-D-glucosyltransferase/alpha-amylase
LHQGQGHWLNWGINRRLAPLLNGDLGANRVMHALLYSLPGLPCLYYGDELGMGDWPGLRDRDPNRTPMAWTPGRNGGFSTAPDPLLVLPPITAPGYDYRVVNVEVQKQLPGSLLNWHRRMLTCRKLLPALRNGDFELLDCAHPGVIVYVRTNTTMTVMVAANLSAAGASFRLDLSRWSGERTREVLWGCDFPPADADWFVYLGPWVQLVVDRRSGRNRQQQRGLRGSVGQVESWSLGISHSRLFKKRLNLREQPLSFVLIHHR